MTEGSTGEGAGRVLLVGALVALMGFLLLTAIVAQRRFDATDRLARTLVHQSHHPLLRPFMEGASFLWGGPGQAGVVLLGSALLWRRQRRWAVSLPVVVAGAGILQLLAKRAVDRPRPNLDPWGFPSGHVLTLVVVLGFIAYIVSMSEARRAWQAPGVGVCAVTVCTVAYSRMYLDAHWLSDVLGGIGSGLAYLLAAIWLISLISARWSAPVLRPASVGSEMEGSPVVPAIGASTAESLVAATAGIVTDASLSVAGP
jgi:membrane-associated phospholipid phosphatase